MPIGHNCRHCGDGPKEGKRQKRSRIFKKRTRAQIYDAIKEWVLTLEEQYGRDYFTKEEISVELQVKEHKVACALQRLNCEGLVNQPEHWAPHDSTRDPLNVGHDSSWQGDIYRLRK